MNFSTNQVMQLFVIGSNESAEVKPIKTPDGNGVRGYIVKIKDSKGNVIDNSDIIDANNILYTAESLAKDETMQRKGLLVKLNSAVNGGAPIAGENYVLTLVYRGFGEEDTYSKVFEAKAVANESAATLLQKLAASALLNMDVEESPLYELYTAAGVAIDNTNVDTITADGFYIVEPVPYWSLGRFEETLMKIDVQVAPVTLEGEEETEWLANYKFAAMPSTVTAVKAIPNTHRIADLEYFCKGERGTSNALVGWPDTPDYKGKVNPDSANGYDVVTIHCAFVGANASNQKSEKDLVFVAEGGLETLSTKLTAIKGIK